MGVTHFDEARSREFDLGHLKGRWTFLGEAAGAVGAGVRRIQVPAGGWSTPAHEHGRQEEIFYVLRGTGLSWQAGETAEIRTGDCIVYRARGGAHSIHAPEEAIDVLAFGPREYDEAVRLPRLGLSLVGNRAVESIPGSFRGDPIQFARESAVGAPALPEQVSPRPSTIVNVDDVEGKVVEREHVARTRKDLGRAAGSVTTGIKWIDVLPGKESSTLHCHSAEEELFVILSGDGVLVLDDRDEAPVRSGHVVARPPATGVAHLFRAGAGGLTLLAYGTREPNDICYYPRSNKISFGGVGVIARLERLEYWDGED
jgi:uncharacterized cupin superfamily protein